jgi:beta-lactamase regulating signal transducer with metallopeptidase domain
MNWNIFAENGVVEHLGWTMVHSIWQIALIAAILFIALRVVIRSSPNARYWVSVFALVLSVIVPVITYFQVSESISTSVFLPNAKYYTEQGPDGNASGPTRTSLRAGIVESTPTQDSASDKTSSISTIRDFLYRTVPSSFPVAVLFWLVGVALFSVRLFGGIWKLHEYKTSGTEPADREWQNRFEKLCALLGVDRKVTLLCSSLVNTPIAAGFIKPLIIVPVSVFLQMDPRQLECIIAHELIHIRRYDCLVNVFQSIAEIFFFYHPAIWWISAEIRREREFAADAAVLKASGDHIVYATALANLEEIRHLTNRSAPSIAMAANGGNLMQRIQRILNKKTETSRAISLLSTGLAIALSSVLVLALFSFSPKSVVNGQKRDNSGRKIAIGFVGIPPVDRSENPPKDADATARLLIAKLQQYKVPAIGFLNGSMISDGDKMYPVRAEIVKMWRDQGLEVGIGGFNHIWFYDTPYDDFVANVEKNETVVKKLFAEKMQPKYFSYPYLNTGRSPEEHDRFESWLNAQGLSSVKYTIDNNEWMYSFAYDIARNDNDINSMKEVRAAFLDYMLKMFDHYETYSREMFGRDIAQTMVLTPSRLVADTADDLFGLIEKRGYRFVSMSDAQADPAYQSAENFFGHAGISWFERWRMKQGQPLLDEPRVDPEIQKIWDTKKSAFGTVKKS